MTKNKKNVKRLKPISLYPLSLEDVLKAVLHTPPIKKRRVKSRKGSKKGERRGERS